MELFNRSQNVVQTRLSKLICPRSDVLPSQLQPMLFNAPSSSVKPITKLLVVAIGLILALWWFMQPTKSTQINNVSGEQTLNVPNTDINKVVVHVIGDVLTPGIVELPAGSRVMDAIAAAGGLTENAKLNGLNLAALVEDGQQIAVGAEFLAADSRVNLNTATAEQLDTLPGIGPVMAARILDWRTVHNRFSSVNELKEIEGIGEKLFNRIKDLIRI